MFFNFLLMEIGSTRCGKRESAGNMVRTVVVVALSQRISLVIMVVAATLHVWGAIVHNWKSELVFLKGTGKRGVNMKNDKKQVLKSVVGPVMLWELNNSALERVEYLEDNTPVHSTKKGLIAVMKNLRIRLYGYPTQSPDLNRIEYIWMIMKCWIKAQKVFPSTKEKFIAPIQEEWNHLKSDDINSFIYSMLEWVKGVIKQKNYQTRF